MSEEKTIRYEDAIREVRKGSRQFALLYFHFCKTLVEELGEEKATPLIQKAIFELGIDRSEQLRERANEQGLEPTKENFMAVTDLPFIGWVKALGKNHCPYAETWVKYYDAYPWFQKLAPLYCDVIDTTNIENFTHQLSHRITQNVLTGGESCERVYYPDENVAAGGFTYGSVEKER